MPTPPYYFSNNQLTIIKWMDIIGLPGVENGRVLHLTPCLLNLLCNVELSRLGSFWIEDHECNAFLPQVLLKEFMHLFIQYLQDGGVPHWNEVNFNANLLQSKAVVVLHVYGKLIQ
jgi:hypothetical protein